MFQRENGSEYLRVTVKELRNRLLWITIPAITLIMVFSISLFGPNKAKHDDPFMVLIGPICLWLGVVIHHVGIMSIHKHNRRKANWDEEVVQ